MSNLSKTEIEKIMKTPGEVKGAVFQTDAAYVKEKKGEQGLKLLAQKTKEWGHPINYEKASAVAWYPIGLRVLSLLAMQEVFGWGDKEIEDLGDQAPKFSFILKIMARYFLSKRRGFEESPKYWAMHYNIGALEAVELSEKKGNTYAIIRLRDFRVHPILCVYYKGFFRRLTQFVLKTEKAAIEETKCMFSGDAYHEFILKWE